MDECKALPRGQPPPQKETHIVHVSSLLNNTFVTLTDLEGDVLTYASGGTLGLTGRGLHPSTFPLNLSQSATLSTP